MDKSYAKSKLKLLLRDIDNYSDGEFWREMSRIAYGSTTGYPNAEQLQTKLAESEAFIEAVKNHISVHGSGNVEINHFNVVNDDCKRFSGEAAVVYIANQHLARKNKKEVS